MNNKEKLHATNSKPNALLFLSFSVFCINEINRMPNVKRKNVGTGPTVKHVCLESTQSHGLSVVLKMEDF